MRAWTCSVLLTLCASCSLGDDAADGTRGQCAEGGELNATCSTTVSTPEQACWRMVDCGAIPLHENDRYSFDWSRCVENIEGTGEIQAQLIMACIGAATCDQLKVREPELGDRNRCFAYGRN